MFEKSFLNFFMRAAGFNNIHKLNLKKSSEERNEKILMKSFHLTNEIAERTLS